MSRFFAMTITDNGAPWTAPDGAAYTVRFGAPGMPAGWYDTITESGGGTHPAVVVDDNTVTVEIAEQAVSTPGRNVLCVLVTDAQGYQIASWPFVLSVQGVPGFDAPEATVYYNALTAQVAEALANAQAAAGSASAAAASEAAAANSAAAAAQSAQKAESAVTGVVSFNGRQGTVTPQTDDYTAEMVGAATTQQIPNFNLLDNTDFANPVNQRGASGTISSAGYFIDRWKLVSGSVEVTDAGLVLNGTIAQVLEHAAGENVVASASAGVASYDDETGTFSVTGTGVTLAWAKLESGAVATPWQPKGHGVELAACLRFFERIGNAESPFLGNFCRVDGKNLLPLTVCFYPKRKAPSISFSAPAQYRVLQYNSIGAKIGAAPVSSFTQVESALTSSAVFFAYAPDISSSAVYALLQRQDLSDFAWIDVSADL